MTTTRQIFIYLGLLVAACVPLNILILRGGGMNGPNAAMLILVLMWAPAVSAILTKLIATRSLKGLGWWPKRFSPLGTAWLAPVIYGGLPFLVAGLVGAGTFTTEAWSKLAVQFGFEASPWIGLALFAGLGTLQSLISATGEEIGWRGLLLPRLSERLGLLPAALLIGLIWGVWHLPADFVGQYAAGGNRALSGAVFLATVVGIGFVISWMRLSTGSVWPAVVLHGVWNAVIQGAFDVSTKEPSIWVGEAGLLVAAASLAVAWVLVRKGFAARRTPREEPFATVPGFAG